MAAAKKKSTANKSAASSPAAASARTAKKSVAKKSAPAAAKKVPAIKTTAVTKAPAVTTAKKTQARTATTTPRTSSKKASNTSMSSNSGAGTGFELPKPRFNKDGMGYTKDFDLAFVKEMHDALVAERIRLTGQAKRLEDEAHQLVGVDVTRHALGMARVGQVQGVGHA